MNLGGFGSFRGVTSLLRGGSSYVRQFPALCGAKLVVEREILRLLGLLLWSSAPLHFVSDYRV